MTSQPARAVTREADHRWLTARELGGLGVDLSRPHLQIGRGWGADREIRLAFSPDPHGCRGFLYAYREAAGRYLLLAPATTRQAVDAARLALGDAVDAPQGYLALAAHITGQPTFTARAAHTSWLNSLETEIALQRAHERITPESPERGTLALACASAAAVRVAAEQTYIDALIDAGHVPVVVDFQLAGRPGWSARLPVPTMRAAQLDVDYVRQLAQDYQLAVHAELPVSRTYARTPMRHELSL